MWDSVDDANKRREIRYGNNIYVLFRALLHCKEFYNQESLWSAIARGFNTNAIIARNTAEILTEARRAQRARPAKDVWKPSPTVLSDPAVHKLADAFFKTQEKKLVNAARVPPSPFLRQPAYVSTTHLALKDPGEPTSPSSRLPQSPSIKVENQRERGDRSRPVRKRSASPPPADRNAKSMRFDHDVRAQPRVGSEKGSDRIEPHRIQPTRSPPRPSDSRPAQPGKLSVQHLSPPSASRGKVGAPSASSQPSMDERFSLKARIAGLEKELSEIKSKPSATLPTAAPAAAPQTHLDEDVVEGLKKDVATVTNAVGTMMESLHDIVDSLNSLQDEVSGLATQQNELTTTVSQGQSVKLNIEDLLRPIQTLSDTVNVLRGEISDLKEQTTAATTIAPSPAASVNHLQTTTNLERLFHEQNARIDTLTRQVAGMQAQMASMPRQQQATGQPQTLRQAMAAAEQDLRHHLNAVQRFYHSLDGTRGGASRAITERTADFLALLTDGLEVAKAWES
ncbi:uncharacterized protein B0T15DRAFT_396313 [Chaetomium strumarium]|uniref:Uncharacterized protein n=1 Tax=Chaetomium strumarium TaxID=1170767 RepID=A0AAJ0GT57_9PEZI|nr:hypothetical protein B0T15DRAFT_396313 [Chaetomium strumarium]